MVIGWIALSPFFLIFNFSILIPTNSITIFMKLAYQNKILENFEALNKRLSILQDVAKGNRQLTNDDVSKLVTESQYLLDSSKSILELVPVE